MIAHLADLLRNLADWLDPEGSDLVAEDELIVPKAEYDQLRYTVDQIADELEARVAEVEAIPVSATPLPRPYHHRPSWGGRL